MNAEQKKELLEFISQALDVNEVAISLTFFGDGKSKEEAMLNALKFNKIIGGKFEEVSNEKGDRKWFMSKSRNLEHSAAFFHDNRRIKEEVI